MKTIRLGILATLTLILAACSSGEPSIISIRSGTEIRLRPTDNHREQHPIILVEAQDSDGAGDVGRVIVESTANHSFWYLPLSQLQVISGNGTFIILVRSLVNTQGQLEGPSTLYLYDKAGHRTQKDFELPRENALDAIDVPRLSKTNGIFRIEAKEAVQLTLQNDDGTVIGTWELSPGTINPESTFKGTPNWEKAQIYLQQFNKAGNTYITSGPW